MPGVIGALLIASVLIGGAYVIANPHSLSFHTKYANAASAQEVLQAYAKKDSDGDGLPDWEEALYGTDPNSSHSVSQTLTDSEAVAQGLVQPRFSSQATSSTSPTDSANIPGVVAGTDTVTAQFAQSLFSDYLSQRKDATPPTQEEITAYVASAMQDFVDKHASQNVYTAGQVKVTGTGGTTLTAYAGNVEDAFAANTIATTKSEVDYFADAVEKNDDEALTHVAAIGKAYTAIAKDFIDVPVPAEAQRAHLNIANSLARLGEDITDMAALKTDPLRAYLGLSQYQTDSQTLTTSFTELNTIFATDNVTIPSGRGSSVYKTAQMAAAPAK